VIFAARGIMVSLAFFALLYSFLSLLLVVAWSCLSACKRRKDLTPDALFTLRVIPFATSAAICLFLTLPSFFLLEAHSLDEDLGTFVLAGGALLFFGAGIYRVWTAETRTRRVVSQCLKGAVDLKHGAVPPAMILPRSVMPLMLVGIRMPRILISESARDLLSDAELRAAMRHETEHLRSRDNLKKAILNLLLFPGMGSLEKAWQEASEWAADDGAVSSRDEALDLAAALIKLTRHFPYQATPELATGLVSVADSVTTRVERLLAWKKSHIVRPNHWLYSAALGFTAFMCLAAKLGPALVLAHRLTERLVP